MRQFILSITFFLAAVSAFASDPTATFADDETEVAGFGAPKLVANHNPDSLRFEWQVDYGFGFGPIMDTSNYASLNSTQLMIYSGNESQDGNVYRCLAIMGEDTVYSDPVSLHIQRASLYDRISVDHSFAELNAEEADCEEIEENEEELAEENEAEEVDEEGSMHAGEEEDAEEIAEEKVAITIEASWSNTPVDGMIVTSEFKSSRTCKGCSSTHPGTDYDAPKNTSVTVTADGEVVKSCFSPSYGHHVIVYHGKTKDGLKIYTLYAHGTERKVNNLEKVKKGDQILLSGKTGRSTDYHVHYEVIATNYTLNNPKFYSDLSIRHKPRELGKLLRKS